MTCRYWTVASAQRSRRGCLGDRLTPWHERRSKVAQFGRSGATRDPWSSGTARGLQNLCDRRLTGNSSSTLLVGSAVICACMALGCGAAHVAMNSFPARTFCLADRLRALCESRLLTKSSGVLRHRAQEVRGEYSHAGTEPAVIDRSVEAVSDTEVDNHGRVTAIIGSLRPDVVKRERLAALRAMPKGHRAIAAGWSRHMGSTVARGAMRVLSESDRPDHRRRQGRSPVEFCELGWMTGFEPATSGATVRRSTAELHPPRSCSSPVGSR